MRYLAILALPTLLLAGCEEPAPKRTAEETAKIELKPVTVPELDQFIADQKGKVVLIDCWFLGCGPCVKKFPTFVKLHDDYAAKGLVCVSLNMYPPEWDERDEVTKFLKEKGATFANFIFKDNKKRVSDWQDKFDANATPHYIAFDRKGKQAVLPERQTPEAIAERVKELLAEK